MLCAICADTTLGYARWQDRELHGHIARQAKMVVFEAIGSPIRGNFGLW